MTGSLPKGNTTPTHHSAHHILNNILQSTDSQDILPLIISSGLPILMAQWWVRTKGIVFFWLLCLGVELPLLRGGSTFCLESKVSQATIPPYLYLLFLYSRQTISRLEQSWVSRLSQSRTKSSGWMKQHVLPSLGSLFLTIGIISGYVSMQKRTSFFQPMKRNIKVIFIIQSSLSRENNGFRARSSS